MTLQCRRCRGRIDPNEPIIVVEVDRLTDWQKPAHIVARLANTGGRWHFACAPNPVKKYAAAVYGVAAERGLDQSKKLVVLGLAALAAFVFINANPFDDVDDVSDLLAHHDVIERHV